MNELHVEHLNVFVIQICKAALERPFRSELSALRGIKASSGQMSRTRRSIDTDDSTTQC